MWKPNLPCSTCTYACYIMPALQKGCRLVKTSVRTPAVVHRLRFITAVQQFTRLSRIEKQWNVMGLIADIFALYLILLFFSFPSPNEAVATTGTVRLWRNGVTSRTYASGRVQVAGFFGSHRWANICGNRKQFDESAAEVICHQLGYSTALGFSKAAQDRYKQTSNSIISCAWWLSIMHIYYT